MRKKQKKKQNANKTKQKKISANQTDKRRKKHK